MSGEQRRWAGPGLLLAIILGAALARLPHLDSLPAGLNQDEASAAIEAYFLAHFGTDRWGYPYPAHFLSWGSGESVLLSYLLAPLVGHYGLNVAVVRVVPAVLGLLAVVATYLLGLAQADRRGALLAAAIIAFAPWNVMASRWALEPNTAPMLVAFALWSLQRTLDAEGARLRRYALVAACFFAATCYAYVAALVPLVILAFLVAGIRRRWLAAHARELILPALLFLLLTTPFLLVMIKNHVIHGPLPFETVLPFSLPLLESSRFAEIAEGRSFAEIGVSNLRFLLSGLSDGLPWNQPPGLTPLPFIVLLTAAYGAFAKLGERKTDVAALLLLATAISAPLFPLNVNRANIVFIPLATLAGFGAFRLYDLIGQGALRRATAATYVLLLMVPEAQFVQSYVGGDFNRAISGPFRADLPAALRLANAEPAQSGPILLNLRGGLVYTLALFHDPASIPAFIERTRSPEPFDKVNGDAFGRYYFSREKLQSAEVRAYVVIQRGDALPCPAARMVASAGVLSVYKCGGGEG